jgi:ACT domain-containing protein
MLAMVFDPDEDPDAIADTVRNADLGGGRTPVDVDHVPDIHVLLPNTPGQLRRAAEALGDINIETVVTIDKQPGNRARVSLGFEDAKLALAEERLRTAGIQIHKHHHQA